jgi:hypothetical protein
MLDRAPFGGWAQKKRKESKTQQGMQEVLAAMGRCKMHIMRAGRCSGGGGSPDAGDDGGLDVQRLQRGLVKLVEQVHPAPQPGEYSRP